MSELFKGILDIELGYGCGGITLDFSGSPATVEGFLRTCEKYKVTEKSSLILASFIFTKEAMEEWTMSKIPPKIDIDAGSVDEND